MPKKLTQKAMLISLSISQWMGRIQDKEISRKIPVDYSAKDGTGTWTKRLFKESITLAKIKALISCAEKYHTEMTLPWKKGVGILPSAKYLEYTKKMREFNMELETLTLQLHSEFLGLIQQDEQNLLGNMYKAKDYPEHSKLRGKFKIDIEASPIPEKGDWRVELSDKELEKLEEAEAKKQEIKIKEAMKKLWQRLYTPIKTMSETLTSGKGFHKTLVTNISDLINILPDLNLSDNKNLEILRKEIEEKLCEFSAQQLKESSYLRETTAEAAEKLRRKIKDQGGIEDVSDKDMMEMMSGYTNPIIDKVGKPVYKQDKMEGLE